MTARSEEDRREHAREARAGWPSRPGSRRVVQARARLATALWNRRGARRLPGADELDTALSDVPAEELAWITELSPLGPLYFLPTRRFVHALARSLSDLGVRRVVEVAAGDGFLARSLQQVAPELDVTATDDGSWAVPSARMTAAERRALAKVAVPGIRAGANVRTLSAVRAMRELSPNLVLCAWLPPGELLDTLIRGPVRYVLELGAGSGVTGNVYSWRFQHEFLDGDVERSARCRLDIRPRKQLHSRVTLYYGRAHPDHFEEKVKPGDWLWQFRPHRR